MDYVLYGVSDIQNGCHCLIPGLLTLSELQPCSHNNQLLNRVKAMLSIKEQGTSDARCAA